MNRRKRGVQPLSKKSRRQFELLGGVASSAAAILVISVFLLTALDKLLLSSNQYASVIASVLVDLTNGDRWQQNLNGLAINETLVKAAQAKADDMAAKSYFAHISPDGKDSWYWFKEAGYKFTYAGENLAVDFGDSGDVERAWMNSPSHRKNLLDTHFTEIGIATASGYYQGHPTIFVVQMFGTPAAGAQEQRPITEIPRNPQVPAIAKTSNPPQVLGTSEGESPESAPPAKKVAQEKVTTPITTYSSPAERSIASPKALMRWIYYLLAGLLLAALAVETGLEIRWHHRRKAAAVGFVFALMVGLFFISDTYVFGTPTVSDENAITASAAAAL